MQLKKINQIHQKIKIRKLIFFIPFEFILPNYASMIKSCQLL